MVDCGCTVVPEPLPDEPLDCPGGLYVPPVAGGNVPLTTPLLELGLSLGFELEVVGGVVVVEGVVLGVVAAFDFVYIKSPAAAAPMSMKGLNLNFE